ncbi:MAG: SphA family protein [Gammaproteobacteria bacterium]
MFKKKSLRALFIASAALFWPSWGMAGSGHYMPGMFNMRDFLVPEKPGMYAALYMGNYSTDKLKNKHGDTVDKATFEAKRTLGPGIGPGIPASVKVTANLDASIDMYFIAPVFMWNSGYKILGADYAMYIALPFSNTSVGAELSTLTNISVANRAISRGRALAVDDSTFNIADMLVQPLWLGWHGKHYDVSAGYAFWAPTGKYNKNDVANTGLGYWTHQLQLAGAYYPFDNKGTAIILAGTYEINQQMASKDFTQGSHFTLNWGFSQFLPITDNVLLEIGPTGYSQWQVQDNHGSDQPLFLNDPNQVHAVGGQIGLAIPKVNAQFNFHYFTEFDAKSRAQGDYAGFTAAVGF